MGILLLLQVTYILISLAITYVVIPNCGNQKRRTFVQAHQDDRKNVSLNKVKKRQSSKHKINNIIDQNISTFGNISNIKKINFEKNSKAPVIQVHSVDVTKKDNNLRTTKNNMLETMTNPQTIDKKKAMGSKMVFVIDFDEEIENKLKGFATIADDKKKNVETENDKVVNKRFESLKKRLKLSGNKNKNVEVKKKVNSKSTGSNKKNNNEKKRQSLTEGKPKEKVAKPILKSFTKSKLVMTKSHKEVIIPKKENEIQSSYANKEKVEGDKDAVQPKNSKGPVEEEEKYVNLADISPSDGLINPESDELILEKTQPSSSSSAEDEKMEQESFREDKQDDEKYETLAEIQKTHI
uniref:Uncharacterized protein n=1 Tax=Strongyloides venezuelensis TaxID=75913 RepID=A0A0K0G3Z6_STRVS